MNHSTALALVVGAAALLLFAAAAAAQPGKSPAYPTRPIRLIVPFAPGGGTDITARTLAHKLTEAWGQQVLIDNRPGANGTIGVDLTAKSAPDGYTLTMISSSHAVNVTLLKTVPYDLVRDLAPVTQATRQPYALVVHPSLPVKTVKQLVALAKARPGALNYGSSGTGGLSHLAGALFGALADVNIVHVPYKGGNPALIDVIAGQIQMLFSTLLQAGPHVRSGKLRALAVTTPKRFAAAPELPTMMEAGVPGYEVTQWYGILAPAKVSPDIIAKLNREIVRILRDPEVAKRLSADGADPVGSTPEEFGAHVRAEIAKYAKLIQRVGIRAE